MTRASAKRTYDNSLREQQAQATRERILDAMAEQLAGDGYAEFSVGRVAKRAGVSEPTIYRHFGGREGLFLAFNEWFEQRSGHPGYPGSIDDFLDGGIARVFAYFEEHEAYIRAARTSRVAEVFKPGRKRRGERLGKVMNEVTEHLDPAEAKQAKAVLRYLLSSTAYLGLKDESGLSTEQAAAAAEWATRVLVDDLRARKPRRKSASKKR